MIHSARADFQRHGMVGFDFALTSLLKQLGYVRGKVNLPAIGAAFDGHVFADNRFGLIRADDMTWQC